jgi:hypothetical protein
MCKMAFLLPESKALKGGAKSLRIAEHQTGQIGDPATRADPGVVSALVQGKQ